jgi:lipid A 3-O-deacylase
MARLKTTTGVAALLGALLVPWTAVAQDDEAAFAQWGGLSLRGTAPNFLDVGVGVFDFRAPFDDSRRSAAGRLEVRGGKKLWFLGPAVGLMANTDGGVFGYGGIYADVAFGNLVLTPLAAFGGYRQGDSSDLGGIFQFRLSLGLSYVFANRHRLGVNFAHISNRSIYDRNPGEEELYVTYAIPF